MSWFNLFGLIFVAAILIPNIIFAATHPDGFENKYNNKTVEILFFMICTSVIKSFHSIILLNFTQENFFC